MVDTITPSISLITLKAVRAKRTQFDGEHGFNNYAQSNTQTMPDRRISIL